TFMTIAYLFVSTINIGVYLYTPELYPTRVRALGVGAATAWLRLASMIGPTVVGMMLAGGLPSVFVTFAIVAAGAAAITGAFGGEPKGGVREEASPWRGNKPRSSEGCANWAFAKTAAALPRCA